jgi:hypothetical protein
MLLQTKFHYPKRSKKKKKKKMSVRKDGWRPIAFERCQLSAIGLAGFCLEKSPQKV